MKHIMIPVLIAGTMAYMFRNMYYMDGSCNYMLAWMIMGLPFGITRFLIVVPYKERSLAASVGLFVVEMILSGICGGIWLACHVAISVWNVLSNNC